MYGMYKIPSESPPFQKTACLIIHGFSFVVIRHRAIFDSKYYFITAIPKSNFTCVLYYFICICNIYVIN